MVKKYIKLVRAKQWVENAFVPAPLLFSFRFTEVESHLAALYAFLAFSFAAGTHYIVNDLQDHEKDALHPQKKYRPLASGAISVRSALITAVFLLVAAGCCIYLMHSIEVAIVITLYLVINVLYTGKLKDIVLLDVFVIAIGFVLRVYAGTYAIHTTVSSYIFMTTLFLALFLGFTKRKGELLRHGTASRVVLKEYGLEMLNSYITARRSLASQSLGGGGYISCPPIFNSK